MKNVKKLLKKAMVFTVAASMLVGTPLTASAAGIRGVYSIQDGIKPEESGTGTVTNTDTGSGVLVDNDAKIIGIVLDKENVNAEKGKKETLKATVVLDGEIYREDENGEKVNITEEVRKKLAAKIRWELSFADGSKDENPAATVSIKSPTDENGKIIDKSMLEVNPRKGTKQGKEVVITAKINTSYYLDENNEPQEYVSEVGTYEDTATVSVKEYSTALNFKENMPTPYVKHTLNLNDYIVRTPLSANDTITWVSMDTKVATVTAAGVVTFKKTGTTTIIAVGEQGGKDEWEATVEAGVQSSRIEIVDESTDQPFVDGKGKTNKADADLGDGEWTADAAVVMYAKVRGAIVSATDAKKAATDLEDAKTNNRGYVTGNVEVKDGDIYYLLVDGEAVEQKALEITDTITWTSNKPAIVSVEGEDDTAVLTAEGVGAAVITAKASSGKTAKVTVTVKATLSELTIENEEGELYSGQSLQMIYSTNPAAAKNKEAVKWSIKKVTYLDNNGNEKEKANPNATINAKGLLKIKPKLDLSATGTDDSYQIVTVVLESKKTKDENGDFIRDEHPIVISQSSLDKITVADDAGLPIAEVYTEYKDNGKATVKQSSMGSANTTYISVPKNRTYTATVEGSRGLDYEAGTDTLTWTTSNAKVASISYTADGKAKITANASGKATITVSGIRAVNKDDGTLKSASVIKTTFKVEVKQPVNTVTLNKSSVVLNRKTKKVQGVEVTADQKVALKATLGPKGVKKEAINWSVVRVSADGTRTNEPGPSNNKGPITAANASINLTAPEIGDVFEITAKTESGAYATSTVTIVNKTAGVAIAEQELGADKTPVLFSGMDGNKEKDNVTNVTVGDKFTMYPCINISADKNTTDYFKAGENACENVTYSVNKKGIVNIDSDGNVYVINKGTVTITAKTPLGKKATLKVIANY